MSHSGSERKGQSYVKLYTFTGKGYVYIVNQLPTALTLEFFLKSSRKCFKYLNIVIPFLCKSLIGKFIRKRKLCLKYLQVFFKIKGIHQIDLSVGEP